MRFTTIKKFQWIVIFLFFFCCGCASSDLSRGAANNFDDAYDHFAQDVSNLDKTSIAEGYQNSSQTTKGVLIGGAAGGLLGAANSSVGAVIGAASGAILGGAIGAYIDAHTTLVDKLQNRGVKVFILGDQVKIIIFSNHLFYGLTPNIRYDAYSTLDMVSCLIGRYLNISVEVAAYTNAVGSERINLYTSQKQAESVAKYLWKRGVRTRFVYAIGRGGTHLVARNGCDWCEGPNYRIEITFEKLPC